MRFKITNAILSLAMTALVHSQVVIKKEDDNIPRIPHFEDFFWTGSGDGSISDAGWGSVGGQKALTPSTIFRTTTVLATLFLDSSGAQQPLPDPTLCAFNCDGAQTLEDNVVPTGTVGYAVRSLVPPSDRRYWLLTIVSGGARTTIGWESKLAKLYSTAFSRQQDRHLGVSKRNLQKITKRSLNSANLNNNDTLYIAKREITPKSTVAVYIHNVSHYTNEQQDLDSTQYTELLYTVFVERQPVLAVTAANDMKLVSEAEVTAELGFPVLTKSEPYLKPSDQSPWDKIPINSREMWIVASLAISACCIFIILISLIVFIAHKRTKKRSIVKERSGSISAVEEADNHAIIQNVGDDKDLRVHTLLSSSTHLDGPDMAEDTRPTSSHSSDSLHSPMYLPRRRMFYQNVVNNLTQTGDDTYQASRAALANQYSNIIKTRHKHRKSKSKLNKKRPYRNSVGVDWKSSINEDNIFGGFESSDQNSNEALMKDKYSSFGSIGSYLSLPTVRSFPKCEVPEPLSRVLEPISVHHLDWDGESPDVAIKVENKLVPNSGLSRHLSVGREDPGVIGPVVWDMHCKNLQKIASIEAHNKASPGSSPSKNVKQANRRYRMLLEDALELWGTTNSPTPAPTTPTPKSHESRNYDATRGRSAIVKSSSSTKPNAKTPRPKSAANKRPDIDFEPTPSRRAWGSGAPSPLVRPLSAGPFHRPPLQPVVDVSRVLSPSAEHWEVTANLEKSQITPYLIATKEELHKYSNETSHA